MPSFTDITTGAADMACAPANRKSSTSCRLPGEARRAIFQALFFLGSETHISILSCFCKSASRKKDSAALRDNQQEGRPVLASPPQYLITLVVLYTFCAIYIASSS